MQANLTPRPPCGGDRTVTLTLSERTLLRQLLREDLKACREGQDYWQTEAECRYGDTTAQQFADEYRVLVRVRELLLRKLYANE